MLFSFLRHLEYERRASSHTILAYKKDLEQFADFLKICFQMEIPENAGHAEIRACMIVLGEQNLASCSVNQQVATLRSYYTFLLQEDKIAHDRTYKIKAHKARNRLPEFLQEETMDKILDAMVFAKDFEGQLDRMVMEFLN